MKQSTYENKVFFIIRQIDVVDALVAKGVDRNSIFDQNMLDFEPQFRKFGWKVTWNKGAYYEPESASHWQFKG